MKKFTPNTWSREKLTGPLNTEATNKPMEILIKLEQSVFEATEQLQNDVEQLNWVKNQNNIY